MHSCLPQGIHFHNRGVHVLVSHHPFNLNSLFSYLPKTERCVERQMKEPSSHTQPQHSPSTSAYLLCPNQPPPSHLSALAKLMADWLPASIFTGWVRCAGTRLYGLPFRECSNSPTYPCRSICDTAAASAALSNDDLINGDTSLAVEWDAHWQGASRGFQRLLVKIEVDTRHPAYEDRADRG